MTDPSSVLQGQASQGQASQSPLREALRLCGSQLRYAMGFSALVNLAYLAPTLYMLGVYDMVVPAGSELTLAFLTLALALTLLVLTYLDLVRGRILQAASVRLDLAFSARVFRRALSGAGVQTGGRRVDRVVREFDTVRAALTGPAALAMFDAPWIPIYVAVCFFVHPAIGGLALGGALILFALAVLNERMNRALARRSMETAGESYAAQEAAGASADVIRALGMGEAFTVQFQAARARANRPMVEAAYAQGRIGGAIRFMRLMLQSAALGLGAWLAIHKQISGGAIFASSMLAARALSPIDQIVAQWRAIAQAVAAYGLIRDQMSDAPEPAHTQLPPPRPRLSAERLSVLAPGSERRLILQNVEFSAEGGQVVGVIGPSGAGKSTLLQVLANARLPDAGEVRIDGARYADWDPRRLGRHIGYLPQDCVLFPGTVKDNISRFDHTLGRDAAEIDHAAVAAAQVAGVHEMILSLPQGYDTALGPRGRGLSAGQQQRIALARALYGDPMLYVLDEPNANLDAEGEASLAAVITRLRARGALVILATHRIGLAAGADQLAVLRAGRLERFGPRQAVLEALRLAAESIRTAPAPEPAVDTPSIPTGAARA